MYKRVLIGLGLVALVVVVGVLFGFWLAWHAPVDPVAEAPQQATPAFGAPALVMGPDGTLGVPEPPQPRIDGSRGLPGRPVVPQSTLPGLRSGAPSTAAAPSAPQVVGTSPVVGIQVPPDQPPIQSLQPLGAPRRVAEQPSVAVPTVMAGQDSGWVQSLRNELARCSTQGDRQGACAEQARWKYCNAGDRWGSVPECPNTGNN